ncbi:hypothetical protein [Paenibacillus plantiphilus]|uniref:hypothetical protein n=1 Tax=Paenibacillus plantiphilus TaxID=2905650 RepID=UPI001F2B7F0D|nr:hypothetical protein [Paenibacillus plantiphilus]
MPKLFNWGDKADDVIEESTTKVNLGKSSKAGDGLDTEGPGKVPNGNSKASTKPQHGYEISEKATGDVAKTGISGQPLNKNGTSPRTNSQVNKWNKEGRI